jgi:hypothetical protein
LKTLQPPFTRAKERLNGLNLKKHSRDRPIYRISKGHDTFFLKKSLADKKGTSPGRSDVLATCPKVKVILWGFFGTKMVFGH